MWSIEIIEFLDSLGGVLTLRPAPGDGSPEISWGDTFFYYAPDGVVPKATQPFATIVTKDYPDDQRSRLNRPDTFCLNFFAGKQAFISWTGHQPREPATRDADPSVADTVADAPNRLRADVDPLALRRCRLSRRACGTASGMDLRGLAMAVRAGEVSPVDHVDEVLARLAGDTCNAVVELLADRARKEARERADELANGGWRGPLHGVAVAVKDLIDVEGVPTRCGSNLRRDAAPAAKDATVVAHLRAAGAVIVAKTHTHELAYGPTGDVAAEGPARNPHDPTRITGGSSSGSAAVVAAGHVPLALGTDTGCSVRTPAALCGVVGLKPAYGRLSTDGVFPLSETCDHVGLLAADVHATAVGYDVLSRQDATGGGIQEPGVRGVVVGVPTDPYWRPADPVIAEAVSEACRRLAEAGAVLVDVGTPDIEELAATYAWIVGAEAYATHEEALAKRREDFQPVTADRLLAFAGHPAAGYVRAQRTRRRLAAAMRRALSSIDVLLTPTTPIRATPIGAAEVDGVQVRPALLSLTLPFDLNGWPAVSVPIPPSDGGLPAGVQVVGVRFEERAVLRVAAALTT